MWPVPQTRRLVRCTPRSFACAARSDDRERCVSLLRGVAGALSALADPQGNELIPLDNEGYDAEQHEQDLLHRRSLRGGMLLNSSELTSLVHLPSASIQLPKLRQKQRRTRAAQAPVLNKPCVLGINEHAETSVAVGLSADQRSRHMQVIGASGTGKSTLLLNMIAQDMEAGDGVAVLDPHGDLIDAVLRLVPPERIDDVILLDPSDDEFPIAFNVLSAHSAMEKDLLASDLVAVFRRLCHELGRSNERGARECDPGDSRKRPRRNARRPSAISGRVAVPEGLPPQRPRPRSRLLLDEGVSAAHRATAGPGA